MARRVPDTATGTGDVGRLIAFLDGHAYTAAMYWACYEWWSRGETLEGGYWSRRSGLGGTYTMRALMWYRHHHRPGSPVYRPSTILAALCFAALGPETRTEDPPRTGGRAR